MGKWPRRAETPTRQHVVVNTVVTKPIQHREEPRRPYFKRTEGPEGDGEATRTAAALTGRADTALTSHVVQGVPQHPEHGHVQWVAEGAVVEVSAGVGLWTGAWL